MGIMNIILYILNLLQSLVFTNITMDNTGMIFLKSEKVFWISISYFDIRRNYIQAVSNSLETISIRILPPFPFG